MAGGQQNGMALPRLVTVLHSGADARPEPVGDPAVLELAQAELGAGPAASAVSGGACLVRSFTKRLLCATRLLVAAVSVDQYRTALSASPRKDLTVQAQPSASLPVRTLARAVREMPRGIVRGSAGCLVGGAGEQQGGVVPGVGAEAGQHAVAQVVQ
jgi:hypothetical protein